MGLSNYQETAFLAALPSPMYVQAHTADPTDTGTASPVAGAPRVSATFGSPLGNVRASDADVTLDWVYGTVPVSHISLWDAAAGGNCRWFGALTAPRTLSNGDTLRFAAGQITVSLD